MRMLSPMAASSRARSSSASTARLRSPLSTVITPCSGLLNSWAMLADSLPMALSFSACRYFRCVSCNSRVRASTRCSNSRLTALSASSASFRRVTSRAEANTPATLPASSRNTAPL